MKKFTNFRSAICRAILLIIVIAIPVSHVLYAQNTWQTRTIIPGWKGWADNPDTVAVFVDPAFDSAQKAEIQAAIDCWNAENCVPALKVTTTSPGQINISRNDQRTNNGAGARANPRWGTGPVQSVNIEIDTDGAPNCYPLSVKELAIHELGHALGLDDTNNASDVMKGSGPTNGNNGALSANDKRELKQAKEQASLALRMDKAKFPQQAIIPGMSVVVGFNVSDYYPPEILDQTVAMVSPFFDDELFVESVQLVTPMLHVGLFSEPNRANGTFYLLVNLIPPEPFQPMEFIGYHYINTDPVEPIPFVCPMEITQINDKVLVNWMAFCSYPNVENLRARLNIDNQYTFENRPTDDFEITIPPGLYNFELNVDDYQINSATFSVTFEITGQIDPILVNAGIDLYTVPVSTLGFGQGDGYPTLPAGFFGPGSDPFEGVISMKGLPSDGSQMPFADMLVNRVVDIVFYEFPASASIETEMLQLNLTIKRKMVNKFTYQDMCQ